MPASGQDGTLKMWNFNNGQRLSEYHGFGENEISTVACIQEGTNKHIAAAGWNHKVSGKLVSLAYTVGQVQLRHVSDND